MTYDFSQPSGLDYDLPALDRITAEDLIAGVRVGIDEHRHEVEAIAGDPGTPTFETVFEALERAGRTLAVAGSTAFNIFSSHGTPEMKRAETEVTALLAAHEDEVRLNPDLARKIFAVDVSELTGEQGRLVEVKRREFTLAGAQLGAAEREELKRLNAQISDLSTRYAQRTSADLNQAAVWFTQEEAAGLSLAQLGAPADGDHAASGSADPAARYRLGLVQPSSQPALASLEHAASRQRLHEASVNRGSAETGGTLDLAPRIAHLRAQRARLLGFATHAEAVLAERSAPSVAAVTQLLQSMTGAAVANAAGEDLRGAAALGHDVRPWDRARALAAAGAQEGGVDHERLRRFLELDTVIHQGVFRAANLAYGLTFTPRPDLPVHHPDARVWEVKDADGAGLGLFIGDYFARDTKRGGAWMNSIHDGASLIGTRPVVMNNLNIVPPAHGAPALITWDNVITLFHEFGHALHGLFSEATYPSLAGTGVERDIVEFPSQVNELWATHPQVLPHFARDVETGERLDGATMAALQSGDTWGEGFATTEYLAAAVLDLAWHDLSAEAATVADPLAFEERVLRQAGFSPADLPPRYRTGYFQHIFAGGYSAGYYSYIWAEVLDADTVEWFGEQQDPREAGQRFREEFLARGNTRDALESYRAYRGRDAALEPLLRRRGLAGAPTRSDAASGAAGAVDHVEEETVHP